MVLHNSHRYIKSISVFMLTACYLNLFAQQHAELRISTAAKEVVIDGESALTESIQSDARLILMEQNANMTTGLELIWRDFGLLDDAKIQLFNSQNSSQYYGYELNDASLFIDDEFGQLQLGNDFNAEDQFNVIRCDGKIYYLVNNQVLAIRDNISNAMNLYSRVISDNSEEVKAYIEVIYPLLCNYDLGIVEQNVIILEPLKTYGVFNMTSLFKIKYYEKYSVNDDFIQVTLRPADPTQSTINLPPIQNEYGLNIKNINMTTVPIGEYWVEISGMNKGEVHQFMLIKG